MTDFGRLGPPASSAGDRTVDGVGGESAGGAVGGQDVPVDGEDAESEHSESCVPADERFTKCRICGERFEMFYDNEEEEWMYLNACYLQVHGVGEGAGEGGDEDLDEMDADISGGTSDDDRGDVGDGEEAGEGGRRRSRQIIVHKLCLDVSGLRDRDEIMWKDLMPGTPRQKKRPASDAGIDTGEAEEEGGAKQEDGDWGDTAAVANGTGGDQVEEVHHWDPTTSNGKMDQSNSSAPSDGMESGPPTKRVKSEITGDGDAGLMENDMLRQQALRMSTMQLP